MDHGRNDSKGCEEDKADGESDSSGNQKPKSKRPEHENGSVENTQLNGTGTRPKSSPPGPPNAAANTLPTTRSDSHFSRTVSLNQGSSQPQFTHRTAPNPQSSEEKREQALEDEATRMFLDFASDPDLMNRALNAAMNPNVARELARQADTAWRNMETVPGGYQALCQMHRNLQQPLWNAVMGHDVAPHTTVSSDIKPPVHSEPIKVNAMPNPWKNAPQQQQQPGLGSFPTSFFGDFNPLTYLSGAMADPYGASPSPAASNDLLSSVINRTSPTSFQTASQLIQNTAAANCNNSHGATSHCSAGSVNSNSDDGGIKYSREIEELAQMGLTDREKCLIALEAADGDIFQALGILEELEKEESQDE
ncbi:uncharacterized protein TOT_020000392 [Theileria orientalis strain Shintoku]|uniref:UBA domain-containing protein n=1 Tax=Theileria orientalis strain Shintoku TaxID=869250 RepID=J4DP57_THEOR|nr:uncharacterized protein TOT_020000392 [Theileria orientalis strain Shintoku]PVC51879.1 hypothetical protein MACL_00001219 [Theileria orientalis]BAM40129.1 uncharacterized protein TOT_020000392 [Theileria orientalis strain Shintoku]|eukprot:XP_009690430.1 uncharacterized protein TOT_020000392 [Theileria orientalis strain Shintoku]